MEIFGLKFADNALRSNLFVLEKLMGVKVDQLISNKPVEWKIELHTYEI